VEDEDDEEIAGWKRRLRSIQKKAHDLDVQIQGCRQAVLKADNEVKDVPLYFGTSERKRDPYPAVKSKVSGSGGFIRPPPIRASRRPAGPLKGKGRRLLYEERFPDYVPGPEQRRDKERWLIRQKLAYSDPKYH
jgi:hypothetical protein